MPLGAPVKNTSCALWCSVYRNWTQNLFTPYYRVSASFQKFVLLAILQTFSERRPAKSKRRFMAGMRWWLSTDLKLKRRTGMWWRQTKWLRPGNLSECKTVLRTKLSNNGATPQSTRRTIKKVSKWLRDMSKWRSTNLLSSSGSITLRDCRSPFFKTRWTLNWTKTKYSALAKAQDGPGHFSFTPKTTGSLWKRCQHKSCDSLLKF